MTPSIPKLREKAVAATPGPWKASQFRCVIRDDESRLPPDESFYGLDKRCSKNRIVSAWQIGVTDEAPLDAMEQWDKDCAFIAAANPAAVIALCDRIAELEAELKIQDDANEILTRRISEIQRGEGL